MLALLQIEFIKIRRSTWLIITTLLMLWIMAFIQYSLMKNGSNKDNALSQIKYIWGNLIQIYEFLLPLAISLIVFLIVDLDAGKWALLYTKNIRIKYFLVKILAILIYILSCLTITFITFYSFWKYFHRELAMGELIPTNILLSLVIVAVYLACINIQCILHILFKKGFFSFVITAWATLFALVALRSSPAFLQPLLQKWFLIPYFFFGKITIPTYSNFYSWNMDPANTKVVLATEFGQKVNQFLMTNSDFRSVYIYSAIFIVASLVIGMIYFKKRQIKD